MRRRLLVGGVLTIIVLSLVVAIDAYRFYRTSGYGIPCDKMPARAAAEIIVREHAATLEGIQRLAPDAILIELEEPCPGRAGLVIYYPTRKMQNAIRARIGADTFHGIPYRFVNI